MQKILKKSTCYLIFRQWSLSWQPQLSKRFPTVKMKVKKDFHRAKIFHKCQEMKMTPFFQQESLQDLLTVLFSQQLMYTVLGCLHYYLLKKIFPISQITQASERSCTYKSEHGFNLLMWLQTQCSFHYAKLAVTDFLCLTGLPLAFSNSLLYHSLLRKCHHQSQISREMTELMFLALLI